MGKPHAPCIHASRRPHETEDGWECHALRECILCSGRGAAHFLQSHQVLRKVWPQGASRDTRSPEAVSVLMAGSIQRPPGVLMFLQITTSQVYVYFKSSQITICEMRPTRPRRSPASRSRAASPREDWIERIPRIKPHSKIISHSIVALMSGLISSKARSDACPRHRVVTARSQPKSRPRVPGVEHV